MNLEHPKTAGQNLAKNSESYRTIVKALSERRTEFYTYKPKEERTYRVVLKDMHYSINPEYIKTEIKNLGHSVTNIWNMKQYGNKLLLFTFFIELQPAQNNNDIFNIECVQQCKIKLETPKYKRDIAQCVNC
jgi:hypothetical protein